MCVSLRHIIPPSHTRIFTSTYGSHKFVRVHGSLRLAPLRNDLRVVRVIMGNSWLVTSHYDAFTVKLNNLFRVVMDNYEQVKGIFTRVYGLSWVYYGGLRFIEPLRVSYNLCTCCYEQLRLNYEYLRALMFLNWHSERQQYSERQQNNVNKQKKIFRETTK